MKKLFFLSIIWLMLAGYVFAAPGPTAYPATTVWEMQQDSTASNVNSCAFDPAETNGTDWSIYPTCKVSWKDTANGTCAQTSATNAEDDLVCTNAANSVCSSVSYNFTTADEGNYINIISGTNTTAGRYRINSVAANAATIDGNVSTNETDSASAITANMGGACGALTDDLVELMTPGNTMYIKYNANAYTVAESPANSEAGTMALPMRFIGYNTNRTLTNSDANRPTLSFSTNNITFSNYNSIRNIIFTGAKVGSQVLVGQFVTIMNCKIENTATGSNIIALDNTGAYLRLFNSEIGPAEDVVLRVHTVAFIVGNYIHDATAGICISNTSAGQNVYIGNIVESCSVAGFKPDANSRDSQYFINNTFYGKKATYAAAIGFDLQTVDYVFLYGNIISDWATGVANLGDRFFTDYNNYYNNDTDGVTFGTNDIDADPAFVGKDDNPPDFRIGANSKAKAFPNGIALPGTATLALGYMDQGALQRVEPSSGGAWAW